MMNLGIFLDKHFKERVLAFVVTLPFLHYYFSLILNVFGVSFSPIFYYLTVFLLCFSLYVVILLRKPVVLFFSFAFLIFLVLAALMSNVSVWPSMIDSDSIYSFFVSPLIYFFLVYLPTFLIFLIEKFDLHYFLSLLRKLSFVTLFLFIIAQILYSFIFKIKLEYMNFAYYALPSIIICFYAYIKTRKLAFLIISLASSGFILIGGSRGSLLTLVVFAFVYVFLNKEFKMRPKNKYILFAIFCGLAVVSLVFLVPIVTFIDNILSKLGYTSRILDTLLGDENGIFHYGDRWVLQNELIAHLFDHFFGFGIFGDRTIINTYAHNWILEFLIDYGIVFGLLFCFFVFFLLFKAWKISVRETDSEYRFWFLFAASFLFSKYMFSGSYLLSGEFWLFIGILLNISNYHNRLSFRTCSSSDLYQNASSLTNDNV